MRNSLALFNTNIINTRNLEGLYTYLSSQIVSPIDYDDLLRSQIVYSVSAFDKLIHDLVRIGMVDIFSGNRSTTPKYMSELISIELHGNLIGASIPPKEHLFEQAIFNKLKFIAYQEPDKVADGLSYIWDEKHKWQKIATIMGMTDSIVKTTLKLIVARRNAIVHEADIDPITNTKFPITQIECIQATDFLHNCGNAIASLVI